MCVQDAAADKLVSVHWCNLHTHKGTGTARHQPQQHTPSPELLQGLFWVVGCLVYSSPTKQLPQLIGNLSPSLGSIGLTNANQELQEATQTQTRHSMTRHSTQSNRVSTGWQGVEELPTSRKALDKNNTAHCRPAWQFNTDICVWSPHLHCFLPSRNLQRQQRESMAANSKHTR